MLTAFSLWILWLDYIQIKENKVLYTGSRKMVSFKFSANLRFLENGFRVYTLQKQKVIIKFRLSILRSLCLFVACSFARKQIFYAYSKRTLFFLSASFKLCGKLSLCFVTIKFHFRIVLAPGTEIRLNQEPGSGSKKLVLQSMFIIWQQNKEQNSQLSFMDLTELCF